MILDINKHFADYNHLNYEDSKIFTDYLSNLLINQYQVINDKSEENKKEWNNITNIVIEYLDSKKSDILSTEVTEEKFYFDNKKMFNF